MRFRDNNTHDRVAAEVLQSGIEDPAGLPPVAYDLVQTARLVEAAPLLGETERAAMRSRTLRAFNRARTPDTGASGPHDTQFSNPEVHAATVTFRDGHATLADMSSIDSERAANTVSAVLAARAARNNQL